MSDNFTQKLINPHVMDVQYYNLNILVSRISNYIILELLERAMIVLRYRLYKKLHYEAFQMML